MDQTAMNHRFAVTETEPTQAAKRPRKWTELGAMGEFRLIDKNDLRIDHKYQREVIESKVAKLAATFSWQAFGVALCEMRADGRIYVVDAQHRLAAAMKRDDVTVIPCLVFRSSGIEGEATDFLAANANRKPVTALAKYKAALVAKDPIALEVKALLSRAGRTVSPKASATSVACVALLMKLVARCPESLDVAWDVACVVCKDEPITDRFIDTLTWMQLHIAEGDSLGSKRWSDRLRKVGAPVITKQMAAAATLYQRGGPNVWAKGVLAAMNKGLREENHFRLMDE